MTAKRTLVLLLATFTWCLEFGPLALPASALRAPCNAECSTEQPAYVCDQPAKDCRKGPVAQWEPRQAIDSSDGGAFPTWIVVVALMAIAVSLAEVLLSTRGRRAQRSRDPSVEQGGSYDG